MTMLKDNDQYLEMNKLYDANFKFSEDTYEAFKIVWNYQQDVIRKHEQRRIKLAEGKVILFDVINKLQKQIDEALDFTEDVYSENWQQVINCIHNILKGETK